MSEAAHLAEALEGLLSRPDNGWFTPITVAVDGLTAAQAATVPTARFNSVWAIVNHVTFWQEFALHRLREQPVDEGALGEHQGWPPAGDPADEGAWQAACARMVEVNLEVAGAVGALADEELGAEAEPGRATRRQIVQGLIAHNSYHTCEAISVRHLQGLWLDQT